MNTFQKLLGTSLLIIAFSIAYYLIIFLPKAESEKLSQQTTNSIRKELKEMQLQQDKDQEEKDKKSNLDYCLSSAAITNGTSWREECKALGLLSQECTDLINMSLEDYFKKNGVDDFTKTDLDTWRQITDKNKQELTDCNCRLPKYNAEVLNGYLKDYKDECFKKYK